MSKAYSAKFIIINLALLIAASAKLGAEEIGFEITADFNSKYIWRGQNLRDDPVFQPAISAGYEGLTVSTWGNVDLTGINGNGGDFSELDYSLDYSAKMGWLECAAYSVGVIYYDFPGTELPDTTEVYWGLSLDVPISPSITVYHDVDEAEGSYVSLGFAHSIEKIGELGSVLPVALEIDASLGWGSGSYNKYYWGIEQSKLNDLVFSVSFPLEVSGWMVKPSLSYVTLLSDAIRDTDAYGTDSDFFVAGIGLLKSF
ncbi:MAG: hypothetical protein WAV28_13495 [Sedimentisphaerales bacterium]